jgi:ATP-binding cassette subfamily B protein
MSVRLGIFKRINKAPLKYIDVTSHGDLQSRMINDVDQTSNGFLLGITTVFDALVSIVLTIILMFNINATISVVIVSLTPISVISTAVIAYYSHKYFRRHAKLLGDTSGMSVEMIGSQKVIKAFNYEKKSIEKFEKVNEELGIQNEKAIFYSSLSGPVSRFINGVIYGIIAIMGILYAIQGNISVGSIAVLLSFANKYIQPFNEISEVLNDLQAAYASARRVANVIELEQEESDENNAVLVRSNGKVAFKNVDFSYTENKELIKNLNLKINKGQRVAIVGPTGSGKSTLINLLMRFYDVNKGEVAVSNRNITKLTRDSLRKKFGMVLQDSWLFNMSIRDNIRYGKPDATDKEVVRAAKKAYAHEYIQTLENGYDTIISEGGENLSQGQKQLICIARVMLVNPPMLILDEATSNVDTRTELYIQNAFNKMMKGRTSFVVAHRLSTIANSDVILVMNKGNIIEQGSHKELLEKKGFYYSLYNSQFSKV